MHRIPLDHISGAERGDLDVWAAQDLHKALPRSGEVTLVLLKSSKTSGGRGHCILLVSYSPPYSSRELIHHCLPAPMGVQSLDLDQKADS